MQGLTTEFQCNGASLCNSIFGHLTRRLPDRRRRAKQFLSLATGSRYLVSTGAICDSDVMSFIDNYRSPYLESDFQINREV